MCYLEAKHFLASVKTMKELTNYIAHILATDLEKDFLIVPDLDQNLMGKKKLKRISQEIYGQ